MPNKDYSDEFFYEYTPKHPVEDVESDRDLRSYSKGSVPIKEERVKSAPAPRKTSTTRRSSTAPKKTATSKSSSKANVYFAASGKFAKGVINKYGEICMTGLGTIIKVIAFIVAFGIIIVSLVLGIMLFASKTGLSAISLLIIIAGTVVAALVFFPIYGIGHVICQNNEILRIFTQETEK